MSLLSNIKNDSLLGKVIRNSVHLFSSNTISLGLSVLQTALAARLLEPSGYGLIYIIMGYASTVNGLLSFRMSELVVRYGGEYIEKKEHDKAAALVKAAMLSEGGVSVLAFLVVVLSAGLASQYIAKSPGTAWMFGVFALGLLANFSFETCTGVLQVLEKIKLQGTINLVQSILTAGLITYAFFTGGSLQFVLFAYLAGKIVLGLGMFFTAVTYLTRSLGPAWWRTPLSALPGFRGMARFAMSSNLSATAILVFRESEVLWVGYFLSSEAAGYYKAAYALVMLLAVPVQPFILTVYPELNRLIVQKAWPRLRDFLRKVTTLAFVYNVALGLGLLIFGRWILWAAYGEEFTVAYPALVVLLVGMIFNFTLFWNRPLLLALSLPAYPLVATLAAGLLKTVLAFPLVPRYGYLMEAALLSLYYLVSVGLMVWRGWQEIRHPEAFTDSR